MTCGTGVRMGVRRLMRNGALPADGRGQWGCFRADGRSLRFWHQRAWVLGCPRGCTHSKWGAPQVAPSVCHLPVFHGGRWLPHAAPSEVGGQRAGFVPRGVQGLRPAGAGRKAVLWRCGCVGLMGTECLLGTSRQKRRSSTQRPLLAGAGPPIPSVVWTESDCSWPLPPWECPSSHPTSGRALGDFRAGLGLRRDGGGTVEGWCSQVSCSRVGAGTSATARHAQPWVCCGPGSGHGPPHPVTACVCSLAEN